MTLQKKGPPFDIDVDKEIFDDWRLKWYAFERLSGISEMTDPVLRDSTGIDALRESFSYSTLRVIRNLPLPTAKQNDVDSIINALEKFIKGNINEVVWIRKFFQRCQQENEAFSDRLVDLRDLSRKYNFAKCCTKCETYQLPNQVVLEARDPDAVQKMILVGSALTLSQARDICESEEASKRDKER